MLFQKDKKLHHAYLLEGDKENIFKELLFFLEDKIDFKIKSNPDFYLGDFDTFGIEDGRYINNFQSKKAIGGENKIIVIKTNFITVQAQNSLLKVFEEPTINTHIFLIMPSSEAILPTLKSRLNIIKHLDLGGPSKSGLVEDFLKSNISKRFDLIKIFLPQKTNEKADKSGAISFLNDLEKILYNKFKTACPIGRSVKIGSSQINQKEVFNEIIKCRSYLNDSSPSVKMILEHISQIIPII